MCPRLLLPLVAAQAVECDMSESMKSVVTKPAGTISPSSLRRMVRPAPTPADDAVPDESLARHSLVGWLVLAIFFGGFGAWAATAPLNGAVVAEAVIKVEGNRKSLQHLEGGTVKEVKIK